MPQVPVSNEQRDQGSAGDANFFFDAQQWIVDLDRRSRRIGQEADAFQKFLSELLKILRADGGHVQINDSGKKWIVASQGDTSREPIGVFSDSENCLIAQSQTHWCDSTGSRANGPQCGDRLVAVQIVDCDLRLELCVEFGKKLDPVSRRRCEETVSAALDLMTPVCWRHQKRKVDGRIVAVELKDSVLDLAFHGVSLRETIAGIAAKVAEQIGYDRVAVLKVDARECTLAATSTLATVDRRAKQVRLLEQLAAHCLAEKISIASQAECKGKTAQLLNQYMADSGATDIRVDTLENPVTGGDKIGVLVSERYADSIQQNVSEQEMANALATASQAVAIAFARHSTSWKHLLEKRIIGGNKTRWQVARFAIAGALFALAWLPVELRVHATGRLLPHVRQRIFAPVEGIVSKVHVVNGQSVTKGAPLVDIESAALDLARQQVLNEIATSKVRLSSLLAARTRSTGGVNRGVASTGGFESLAGGDLAASEEALKAKLVGLEEQLLLIDTQRGLLQLTSPIDGLAMRWDMNQVLAQRPVAAGQLLLEVISNDEGWIAELEVPDAEIGYVQTAYAERPVDCSFRFRSNPNVSYAGQVSMIDTVSKLDSRGEPIVRVRVPIAQSSFMSEPGNSNDVSRVNAGLIASIDCGKRPLIVVYTRGLVYWARVHLGLGL